MSSAIWGEQRKRLAVGAKVQSLISNGAGGLVIDIECHLSNNLPSIVIVGFANKAVNEAKDRIRGAFASSHLELPRKRITINLAPADLPKDGSGFDMAIATGILLASWQIPTTFNNKQAIIGELSLDGSVRAVRGIIGKILAGRDQGLSTFFIPTANLAQAKLIPHITLLPFSSLKELYNHCNNFNVVQSINTGEGMFDATLGDYSGDTSLVDVVGQDRAKRALIIAAAGGHNVFFNGPPGTGKSMLAKTLPSILPPLNYEEVLEVTHLHSLASHNYEQIITRRPFRAPHHSASHVAVIGGGQTLRPGEISLSHRGVLFFDELPEFSRSTLEALRQPLEDKQISVARAKESADFPANFILVATANPCPCGYYGIPNSNRCRCHRHQILNYQSRLSGPILDRIDLYADVHEIDHTQLLDSSSQGNSQQALDQVTAARRLQAERFGQVSKLNSDMTNADIKRYARLTSEAKGVLNGAAGAMNMSARAYMRTIKVARTFADLVQSPTIAGSHLGEALAYRRPELPRI